MGDATKFLDFLVLVIEIIACEKGTLFHPLKLCSFIHFEDISSTYFATDT
jgi:hypothetical protein